MQYPVYTADGEAGDVHAYSYAAEHAHAEYKGPHHHQPEHQLAHFPPVYEDYYPPPAAVHIVGGAPDGLGGGGGGGGGYPTGAIELGHMCVPASEFMGGYVQYAS